MRQLGRSRVGRCADSTLSRPADEPTRLARGGEDERAYGGGAGGPEVARGSTLLNINQQIGSSVGVAVISVILTAHLNASDLAKPAMAATLDPTLTDAVGGAAAVAAGLAEAAAAFADTFWVAWVLVVLTLVPAFFLPRKHEQLAMVDEQAEGVPPVIMH